MADLYNLDAELQEQEDPQVTDTTATEAWDDAELIDLPSHNKTVADATNDDPIDTSTAISTPAIVNEHYEKLLFVWSQESKSPKLLPFPAESAASIRASWEEPDWETGNPSLDSLLNSFCEWILIEPSICLRIYVPNDYRKYNKNKCKTA